MERSNDIRINDVDRGGGDCKQTSCEYNYDGSTTTLVGGDIREFACGWGAAVVNITLTFPINKLIFRQMLHGISVRNAFLQIMDEGFVSMYRGMLPPLMQKSVSSSLMFGTYDMFRKPLLESRLLGSGDGRNTVLANSIAAALAGSVEALLAPFERIQTLLQDKRYQKEFSNMKHAIKVVGLQYGYREYYRGFIPILLRNGPSNVIFFVLREQFTDSIGSTSVPSSSSSSSSANRITSGGGWMNGVKQFFVGACIGALNSTLFYPYNVIKVHMQSRLGGPFTSVLSATREIYVERGRKLSHFYKGVHMNYTRSFISWGVINLAYERFKILFYD